MAAMLKLCPKEIQDILELRWDEVGEKYETLKDRVVGWATTRTEKKGGPVPMDVDEVEEEEEEDGIMAWGKLHAKYSQQTMSRLMRLQQDCMHPKVVKVGELVEKCCSGKRSGKKWRRSSR